MRNYSEESLYFLILEEVTSVNISMSYALEAKIWWDSQLLLCSPIPQSRRAAGLYGLMRNSIFIYTLYAAKKEYIPLDTPVTAFYCLFTY
jgi:hypothetical protein